jgi:hypothetical protein
LLQRTKAESVDGSEDIELRDTAVLFRLSFLLPCLGKVGSNPKDDALHASGRVDVERPEAVGFFGNVVPLLQAAYDPNDHTDKHYGSDQSVSQHCSLLRISD